MSDGKEIADQVAAYGGTSLLAATCRIIITADRYTFAGRLRVYLITLFVAWICFLFLTPSEMNANWKIAIVGVASLLADDIIRSVITLGQKFLQKPLDIIADYLRR